jgi:CBS domain-containing protein
MKDFNTGVVPVIENEQSRRLIGVVTDRDLCVDVIADGRDPETVQVGQCMTKKVIACLPDDDVQKVLELMRDNQIRRVVVVDGQNVIQGVVSMADLMQRMDLSTNESHETLKRVTEPAQTASKPRGESFRKGV